MNYLHPCLPESLYAPWPACLRLLRLKFYPEKVLQCGQPEPDSPLALGRSPRSKQENWIRRDKTLFIFSQAGILIRWSHDELLYCMGYVMWWITVIKCNSYSMTTQLIKFFCKYPLFNNIIIIWGRVVLYKMESYKGRTKHWFTLEQQLAFFPK